MVQDNTMPSGAPKTCPDCHVTPALEVLQSAAGYYIGTQCQCGPYSRESLYFATKKLAQEMLRQSDWSRHDIEP